MTDLTKITTAFGLLDEATQKALKAHNGELEYYGGNGWTQIHNPSWSIYVVYRVKVKPPKPREWFASVDRDGNLQAMGRDEGDIERASAVFNWVGARTIKVREVIE